MSRPIILLIILCFTASSKANNTGSFCPEKKYYFSKTDIVFCAKTPRTRVYLITNNSDYSILLNHPVKYPSASAGWASQIDPKRWSAFVVSRKNFVITCQRWHDKSLSDRVPCRRIVMISEPCIIMTKNNEGDYWLAENKNISQIRKALMTKGWMHCLLIYPKTNNELKNGA